MCNILGNINNNMTGISIIKFGRDTKRNRMINKMLININRKIAKLKCSEKIVFYSIY